MFSSEVLQILKFGLVGVWNTGFDLAIFFGFFRLLKPVFARRKFPVQLETVCHTLSFLIANTVSYQLNSRFTFEAGESQTAAEFGAYVGVSVVSLGISALIINFLAQDKFFDRFRAKVKTARPQFELKRSQYALIIKLVAVVIVMAVNYLGYKYLVFGG